MAGETGQRQDDAAAEAVPRARARRRSRTRSRGGSRRARVAGAHRGGARASPLGSARRLRGALRRPLVARESRIRVRDRRAAARRDPARPAAAPLRHGHHRRGARAVSLNIDFLLGRLKSILPQRPDLKVIITSRDDRPRALRGALRRRADRRGERADVSGRDALPAAADEADPSSTRSADAVEELARAGSRRRARVPVAASARSATRPSCCAAASHDLEVLPLYARLCAGRAGAGVPARAAAHASCSRRTSPRRR